MKLKVLIIVALTFCVGYVRLENWSTLSAEFDFNRIKVCNGDFLSEPIAGQTGMVVYTEPVTAHMGFTANFIWSNYLCQPINILERDYYDGFNFIISETDPSTSMDFYRQGYMYLPNSVIIGYNSYLHNEFYVCYWDAPPLYSANVSIPADPPQPPFFRRSCKTFPALSLPLTCSSMRQVTIQNTLGTINMYMDGRSVFSFALPRAFRPVYHYVGLSAYNTIRTSSYHQFSVWNWNSPSEITPYSLSDTRVSALGQATVDTLAKRIWLTKSLNGTGLVILQDYQVQLTQSWTFNFKWTLLGNAGQSVSEGFALFLTKPRRELETLTSGGLGIQTRPNTTIIGFNSALNEFYHCSWNVPIVGTLRNACSTFSSPLPLISLNRTITFEVSYNQDLFKVYANNELMFASILVLDKSESYRIGFAGASGTSNIRQYISDWSKTTSPAPTTNYRIDTATDINTYGSTLVNRDIIQMTNSAVGLVLYKSPIAARSGFSSTFQWRLTNCTSDSGFTLFLTTTLPSDVVVSPINSNTDAGYGTSSMSRLTSFSLNYTSSLFTAYFNSTLGEADIYSVPVNLTQFRCADLVDVRIEYTASNVLNVYLMNVLVTSVVDRANTVLNPAYYYLGLGGIEGSFNGWAVKAATLSIKRQFSYFGFNDAVISTLGTTTVANTTLRLTTAAIVNAGAAHSALPVYAHTGFNSNLTWTATNCDPVYNGADGFTLFLSKSRPVESDVSVSRGGLLGIGSVPNVTMFAYSATFNEFYVCNWTTPLTNNFRYACSVVIPSPIAKVTCSNSTNVFEHNYDGRNLRIRVNGAAILSTPLKLDPVPYFVGLSGATGGGYFTQDVSNWTFDSTAV